MLEKQSNQKACIYFPNKRRHRGRNINSEAVLWSRATFYDANYRAQPWQPRFNLADYSEKRLMAAETLLSVT